MTSRERVLAAIRHEQPNQVPVDMGATPSSGISAINFSCYSKTLNKKTLKRHLNYLLNIYS